MGSKDRWSRLRLLAGAGILAVIGLRLGTGPFLDALGLVTGPAVACAVGIGVLTTVCSAWRWSLVAQGLGIRLPLVPAVGAYYRALFLNAVLPGGVLGDVHRAVRHGQDVGDVAAAARAVVLERTAGQVALLATAAVVLPGGIPPVLGRAGGSMAGGSMAGGSMAGGSMAGGSMTAGAGVAGAVVVAAVTLVSAVVLVSVVATTPARRRLWFAAVALRTGARDAWRALASRDRGPAILATSAAVVAGHVATFLVAARAAGVRAPIGVLVPLALTALLAMSVPLNVAGWGPREGATAWAFAAVGLSPQQGLTVSVIYGLLALAAGLPGAAVLLAGRRLRFPARGRSRRTGLAPSLPGAAELQPNT